MLAKCFGEFMGTLVLILLGLLHGASKQAREVARAGAEIPGSLCSPSSSSNLRGQPVYPETESESHWKSALSSELNSRKKGPS